MIYDHFYVQFYSNNKYITEHNLEILVVTWHTGVNTRLWIFKQVPMMFLYKSINTADPLRLHKNCIGNLFALQYLGP